MQLKCTNCGEYRLSALHRKSGLCHNCRTTRRVEYCVICGQTAPYEMHHLVPQTLKVPFLAAKSTIPLCLNCHKCVTRKYYELFWLGMRLNKDYSLKDSIHDALHAFMMVFEEQEERYHEQARNYPLFESTYSHEISEQTSSCQEDHV